MLARGRRPGILFVDLGETFGGAEIYLLSLLSSLRSEVDCIVLCSNREFQERLLAADIPFCSIFSGTGLMKIVQLVWAACRVAGLLLFGNLGTLQINGYSEIVLLSVARLLGRRAVPTRHLSFEIEANHWFQAPGRYLARALYRWLARTATQIVCVSAQVGQEVEALAPGKSVVIPNWVHQVPRFQHRKPLSERPVVVLFVGRMVKYKGLHLLLEAVRIAQQQTSCPPLRVIAVGDGPYRPELEQQAVGLQVEFAGFQRDVAPFYGAADLFVSSSLGPEGSSLVTMEAMAHGVPCILSDLPVHREIARDGAIAALFRNGDAQDLASTIVRLGQSSFERDCYARRAYDVIQDDHTSQRATQAYLQVLAVDRA